MEAREKKISISGPKIHFIVVWWPTFSSLVWQPNKRFYTCSPPASSAGILDAIRREQYTHTPFKNREGPDSPTRRLTLETSLLKWSLALWLLSKTSITTPFSSSSLLREGILCLYSLLSHWIFHKSTFFPLLAHTHTHTANFLTEVFSLSFPHALHICHLQCFVSIFHSSLFSCPLHLNLISFSQHSPLPGTSAHSLFFFTLIFSFLDLTINQIISYHITYIYFLHPPIFHEWICILIMQHWLSTWFINCAVNEPY